MRPIPIELPLKADEASSLAGVLFDHAEGRALTDDSRQRLASRLPRFSFDVFCGSLQKDPIHPSVYYIAVAPGAVLERTLLLRIALASSPSSGLFPNALLIGRMRAHSGREIVINAVEFGPHDRQNIRTYAEQLDRAFVPRPQGTRPAIEVSGATPLTFHDFRSILNRTRINMASLHSATPEQACWCAILAGWREGYTVATDVADGQPVEPGFTKYNLRTASLLDQIAPGIPRDDLELATEATTPDALARELQSRAVQFIAPPISLATPNSAAEAGKFAELARSVDATLSLPLTGEESPALLAAIGQATGGRVNCKVSLRTGGPDLVRLASALRS